MKSDTRLIKPVDMVLWMQGRMIQGKKTILVAKIIKKGYNMIFKEGLTNSNGFYEKG